MRNKQRIRVYPYKAASNSAKVLAQNLGGMRLKLQGSQFIPREHDKIINWGSSSILNPNLLTVINDPTKVQTVSNKLTFFQQVAAKGVSSWCVPWTPWKEDAAIWLYNDHDVVVRHKLSGHSGEGIEILKAGDYCTLSEEGIMDEIPSAALYTRYIKKNEEYRIHIAKIKNEMGNEELWVFDQQRKALRPVDEFPRDEINYQVRNHSNGYMYVRQGFTVPDKVIEASTKVFAATGLDFGAVDVIYNSHSGHAYVLEINTAPGLTGTTLERYTTMFKTMFELS